MKLHKQVDAIFVDTKFPQAPGQFVAGNGIEGALEVKREPDSSQASCLLPSGMKGVKGFLSLLKEVASFTNVSMYAEKGVQRATALGVRKLWTSHQRSMERRTNPVP